MTLIHKYPDGRWEDAEDDRECPVCESDVQVFTYKERPPHGGRLVKYVAGERCLNCGWEVETG